MPANIKGEIEAVGLPFNMGKIKTEVGSVFGNLIIVKRLGKDKSGHRWAECKCKCGNITKIRTSALLSGDNKTCGQCTTNIYEVQGDTTIGRCKNGFSFIFDTENLDLVKPFQWCKGDGGYVISTNRKRKVSLHKLVFGSHPNILIDHINRDKTDCRKSNLRPATTKQNNWNRSKTTKGVTSKYIGVSFCCHIKRYKARIFHLGIEILLGTFKNEDEAAQARNIAGRFLRGDFHCDNNVPEADIKMKREIEQRCTNYIYRQQNGGNYVPISTVKTLQPSRLSELVRPGILRVAQKTD